MQVARKQGVLIPEAVRISNEARDQAARLTPEDRKRLASLAKRAVRHRTNGALRRGILRGMLASSIDEQTELEVLGKRLWGNSGPDVVAMHTLTRRMSAGSVGATAVLAALGDSAGVRRMVDIIVDATETQPRRLAAVRGTLVVWQVAREQGWRAPVPLMASLRRATRDFDDHLRYTAAFVLAMMGRREIRTLLEHGLDKLQSPALLSYCVLGLREVGTATSAGRLRRFLPRCAGALASTAHDALQAIELRLSPPRPAQPSIVVPGTGFHERETVRLEVAAMR